MAELRNGPARHDLLGAMAHVPLELARLQQSLPVGAAVELRFGSTWSAAVAQDLVEGAGFDVARAVEARHATRVRAVRARTLPDFVGPHMRLLVCGLNPSVYAADAGVNYARPGNRFWPGALAAGLVSVDRDPWHALDNHGVGLTDLVKRATRTAAELTAHEYRAGLARVERLCERLRPPVVLFVGMSGWRAATDPRAAAGWQDRRLGPSRVYLMPSTSGLNAHAQLPAVVQHMRAAVH